MTTKPSKRVAHKMRTTIADDVATLTYTCPLCGAALPATLNRPKPGLTFVNLAPASLRHLADNHVAGERL